MFKSMHRIPEATGQYRVILRRGDERWPWSVEQGWSDGTWTVEHSFDREETAIVYAKKLAAAHKAADEYTPKVFG